MGWSDRSARLKPTSAAVFNLLLRSSPRYVSGLMIEEAIWPDVQDFDNRRLYAQIAMIRLEIEPLGLIIDTQRDFGYRLRLAGDTADHGRGVALARRKEAANARPHSK